MADLRGGHGLYTVLVGGYHVVGVVDCRSEGGPCYVATVSNYGDWAAYEGTGALIADICQDGRKLRLSEAAGVFPLLNPAAYRK